VQIHQSAVEHAAEMRAHRPESLEVAHHLAVVLSQNLAQAIAHLVLDDQQTPPYESHAALVELRPGEVDLSPQQSGAQVIWRPRLPQRECATHLVGCRVNLPHLRGVDELRRVRRERPVEDLVPLVVVQEVQAVLSA
jgi:hypothetical protein